MSFLVDLSRISSQRRVIAPFAVDRGRKNLIQFHSSPSKARIETQLATIAAMSLTSLVRSIMRRIGDVFYGCSAVRTTTILDYIVRTDTI